MRKKLKEKVSISQNIFIDFERGIIYQDNDDSNIIKLTPNEVKIIKLLCTRNNKYVINQEILEYIYGKNNDNIALITRTMSKLRSKQTNKIMLYDIIISDGRGRFKICLTESPFEDSELEGNNAETPNSVNVEGKISDEGKEKNGKGQSSKVKGQAEENKEEDDEYNW